MQFLFYLLFFVLPLTLWPKTAEIFEFNKIIFVYFLTTLIAGFWIVKMIKEKKIIFRRTLLDIPLLIFLLSQLLATVFSINRHTSLLGYYSRFNGGLISSICYSLLYWAYVANMNRKKTLYAIRYTLFSAVLVCLYAVLQHFGIDKNIWVQDVQNRVFSTLGQPNWLAAFLVALMPLAMSHPGLLSYFLSFLFFTTLLFTKSRSGLLGFATADLLFWGFTLFKFRKKFLKEFLIFNLLFLVLFLFIKSPITSHQSLVTPQGPSLEVGGTESGTIRKIVWQGAFDIWRHYPVFGSGVETFAFAYYRYRPVEHNLISEWDFLYNKAHNEYLNLAATTGAVGLFTYLTLLVFIFLQLLKSKNYALLAGYTGLLVTNFFGFSVVVTQVELFLFPAFAITLGEQRTLNHEQSSQKLTTTQKTLLVLVLGSIFIILYSISRYWLADVKFAQGKAFNESQNFLAGQKALEKAVSLNSGEAIFRSELSLSYGGIALLLKVNKIEENLLNFTEAAVAESDRAISLAPANINLYRSRATLFLRLAALDPKYLISAKDTLLTALTLAPTDAKIYYNLALTHIRLNEINTALIILDKTLELKPNYKDARYLTALLYKDQGNVKRAKEELTYILEKIDPHDENAQKELAKLQ